MTTAALGVQNFLCQTEDVDGSVTPSVPRAVLLACAAPFSYRDGYGAQRFEAWFRAERAAGRNPDAKGTANHKGETVKRGTAEPRPAHRTGNLKGQGARLSP